jgi:hypothetical protein
MKIDILKEKKNEQAKKIFGVEIKLGSQNALFEK